MSFLSSSQHISAFENKNECFTPLTLHLMSLSVAEPRAEILNE